MPVDSVGSSWKISEHGSLIGHGRVVFLKDLLPSCSRNDLDILLRNCLHTKCQLALGTTCAKRRLELKDLTLLGGY